MRTLPWIRLSGRQQLLGLLALAFLARLLTLGGYPLTESTEARYGEIARKMLETGQWLVPQIDYGVPFWGKPPLSVWLTAISFKLLGVTEFAARISSLLLGAAVCALVYRLGRERLGVDHGLRASVVVATSLLMLVSAGSVMTDPAMVLGTTLSMVAFWLAQSTGSRSWGILFFVGLAIGMLAKGPVAVVLSLAPVGLWAVVTGRCRETWHQLPWVTGSILTLLLIVPWYWAAEVQNPGFLQYFIVGEHWQRFTQSGWNGDLYGSGHPYPRGTIWLFALLGTLPWSPWLVWQWVRRSPALQTKLPGVLPTRPSDGWSLYLVCWVMMPLAAFTLARNILPTYVLPALAGFGLLVADAWQRRAPPRSEGSLLAVGLIAPLVLLVAVRIVVPVSAIHSQKDIVAAYRTSVQEEIPLFYFKRRPYSAEFYSGGSAGDIEDLPQLRRTLAGVAPVYVATKRSNYAALPADVRARLEVVGVEPGNEYVLLRHERTHGQTPARPPWAAGAP